MSLIGQRWKYSNVWSWLILISRKLNQSAGSESRLPGNRSNYSVQFSGYINPEVRSESFWHSDGEEPSKKLVLIAMRVHLFPSRTQKLSSSAPTILAGRLAGKIGNANIQTPNGVIRSVFFIWKCHCHENIVRLHPKRRTNTKSKLKLDKAFS